jgi:hypothetical protein
MELNNEGVTRRGTSRVLFARIQLRRVRVDCICAMIYALVMCSPCQVPSFSFSLNRRTYTLKVSSNRLLKALLYSPHFPLRFAPLARIILGAVSVLAYFANFGNGVWTWAQAGM